MPAVPMGEWTIRVPRFHFFAAVAVLLLPCSSAVGASQPATATQVDPAPGPDEAAIEGPVLEIPALTPVEIVIDVELGSKLSTTGQMFPILLSEPIKLGDRIVIPAGTPGMGEVVHAKKAGGGGTGGELVLAARYLLVGDRQLKLRSMKIVAKSKDAMQEATAASIVASPLGFLVTGTNIVLPKGAIASVKTAEPFTLPEGPGPAGSGPAGSVSPAPVPATMEPVKTATEGSKK